MPPSHNDKSTRRPTLPPIRDLFRDELAQQPNNGYEQAILERLRVHDDSDLDRNLSRPQDSSSRHYADSSSRKNQDSRLSFVSQEYPNGRSDNCSSTESSYQSRQEPSHRIEYEHLSLQRSMSHQFTPRPHEYHGHSTYDDARITTPSPIPAHRDSQHGPYGPSSHSPAYPPHGSHTAGVLRPSPSHISTGTDRDYCPDDEDRTPIARYPSGQSVPHSRQPASVEEPPVNVSSSKYECQYCGKGFNRPSSLKIHLNSHTGEKPFVCPVEGCGRSFSVLSNMRRHARVHSPGKEKEGEASDDPLIDQGGEYGTQGDSRWHQRRSSTASTSSSASRRSRSGSYEEEMGDLERPEKRSRHLT